MQCTQFRQIVGAEPSHESAEVASHRAECRECAAYASQMVELDALLRRALELPVQAQGSLDVALPAIPSRRRWFAMAAGLALSVAVGFSVWLAAPRSTVAADLIAHVEYESAELRTTDARIAQERIVGVLNRAGVRLDPLATDVSFASTCPLRGKQVPHLIVQTASGPVTVIVLPEEQIDREREFDEQGFVGVLLPSGPGSVAVIARDAATVRDAAARVTSAISWSR